MTSKEKQIVLNKLFGKTAMTKRTAKSRVGGGKGGNSVTATTSEGETRHAHNTRNRRKHATSEGILQKNPTDISLVNNYVDEPCDGTPTVPLDDMSSQLKWVTQKGPEAVGSQPWNPVASLQEIGSKTSCPIPWARLCLQTQEEQESDFGLNFEEWHSGNGISSVWSVYGKL